MGTAQTNCVSIAEFIRHLGEELEIAGADGLEGNEMEIIALVRNCPFLYNKSYPDFRDLEKKNQAWQAMASLFNVSGSYFQQYWKYMREQFARYTNKSASDIKAYQPYYDEMNFLLPFIHRRNRSSGSSSTIGQLKEESNTPASSEIDMTCADHELILDELIEKVHENSILYDRRHKDAKNHDLKLKTWKKVAKDLGIPVSECVNRWKMLREKFARERKYRKTHSQGKKWYLYEKLTFLEDHVLSRNRRYSRTQMLRKKSSGLFNTTNTTKLFKDEVHLASDPFVDEHRYCKLESENDSHDIEYITVHGPDTNQYFIDNPHKEDITFSTSVHEPIKNEDELFALAIAAELKKISCNRKKMKLKADIYRLLYENSE